MPRFALCMYSYFYEEEDGGEVNSSTEVALTLPTLNGLVTRDQEESNECENPA